MEYLWKGTVSQNFHTKNLGKITIFSAVLEICYDFWQCWEVVLQITPQFAVCAAFKIDFVWLQEKTRAWLYQEMNSSQVFE